MKRAIFILALCIGLSARGQNQHNEKRTKGPAENFTGTAWVTSLVPDDSILTTIVSSVSFEPGARTVWHKHPSGQILLVQEGNGLYQEKGNRLRKIKKGDVVRCKPDVEHWHGAAPNTSMTHVAINPNTEKGVVTWLQAVTEKEYQSGQ